MVQRRAPRCLSSLSWLFLLLAPSLIGCQSGGGGALDQGADRDLGGGVTDLQRPTDLPPGGCTVEQPCAGPIRCLPPGVSPGCGACRRPDPSELCQSDSTCKAQGATQICAPGVCLCQPATVCVAGCTGPADCPEGTVCGADNRCAPRPCALPDDCPRSFTCQRSDGGAGTCARTTCKADRDCPLFCVEGACYDAPGSCTPPPP